MAYNANTVLLLHCDGTDASTTFTDSESTPKTVTANGNAQIDTAQSKFGGASGLFDGTGDYLILADSADWDFTGDFTIDCWYKSNTRQNYAGIVSTLNYGSANIDGWRLATDFIGASNQPAAFSVYVNNATTLAVVGTSDINTGSWVHLEVTRSGNSVRLFVNGTQEGSTGTLSGTILAGGGGLMVGRGFDDFEQGYVDGWIDEVQVLKGQALNTTNFTPPTAAYDNPGSAFIPKIIIF